MEKLKLIKDCIGSEDVDNYVKENLPEFERYFIFNKSSTIKKGKLIRSFKKNLRLLHENKEENIYLFFDKKVEVADRGLKDIKCVDQKKHFIFKIDGNEFFLYGNKRSFNKNFRTYKKEELKNVKLKILEKNETGIIESFDESKFIEKLFEMNKKHNIVLYEILFNSLDVLTKRIRCQFSSELKKDDILELLSKEELKKIFLEDMKIGSIRSICFRDNDDNQETLKINQEGNGKLYLNWSRKVFSDFKKKLSAILEINENETIIYNYPTTLDNLLREVELNWYHKKYKYKDLLKKYSDYISLTNNKIRINYTKIVASLKDLLKNDFRIEYVNYSRKNKLIFPATDSKKKKNKELLCVRDKKNKIVNYFYINETKLYEDKDNFLRDFFIFMPCFVLDLRQKKEGDYYLSCSNFIENLENKNANYFIRIFKKNKKDVFENIESNSFKEIFDIADKEIIQKFDYYNKGLSSQRKGEIYEKIVFILFSLLFKIERLGGVNRHDGNLFVENNLIIGYDSKNLEKNTLNNFINKKSKKFKDIGYIKKNEIKYYFFIFKKIDERFFRILVSKIKEELKEVVFIKAFDISFVKKVFKQIDSQGILNYSRQNKQTLVRNFLVEEDKILK